MRAETHRGDFFFSLEPQPGGDDVFGEYVAAEQEVLILLEGVEGFV